MKVPSSTPEKPAAAKSQPLPGAAGQAPETAPPPAAALPTPQPFRSTTRERMAAQPEPRRSEEKDYVPRYVALPRQWERGHGRRNLISGVGLLLLTVLLLSWALYLAGPGAIFTVAVCAATATLLHVMARSRLFRQRNGSFVAWAGVCLLGVVLVILQHGWLYMTGASHARPADQQPATVDKPAETPLLREAFNVGSDPVSGPVVRIVRDTKVSVDGKPYLVKAGELYPLVDSGLDERGQSQLRFSVGLHDVLIAKGAGEVLGNDNVPGLDPVASTAKSATVEVPPPAPAKEFEPPKNLSKADQTVASQREAIRRYPGLGRAGSPENRLFLSARKELEMSGEDEFFKDPNWPLHLAEECAAKDGWKRADIDEPVSIPRAVPPTEPARRPSIQ